MGYPVGSNFEPIEKFPNPIVSLDASQKYLSDCKKSFDLSWSLPGSGIFTDR